MMTNHLEPNNGMQDINLADTLIGQSFNDDISNSLSPSQSDNQTDFDTSRSNTDLSPSVSNQIRPFQKLIYSPFLPLMNLLAESLLTV